MLFGATAAFAQGYPLPRPSYGSAWTANKLHDEKMAADAASNAGQASNSHGVKRNLAEQNSGSRSASGG